MSEKCVFERNGYCTCITRWEYKCDDEETCEKRHPKINKDSVVLPGCEAIMEGDE